jgi:diaminohydroxyphosphoribosylaminopyrimidine deaminase/5-amino-6-(5-phosphoribosylamino)uracil reductase
VLKLALSLDGAIAEADRLRSWITGEESRREVHRLRAGHDAVAVGIGTALIDDPMLNVRDADAPRVPPRRIVFDRAGRLPLHSALVRTAHEAPVTVVTESANAIRARDLHAAGVEIIEASTLSGALGALGAKGVRSVLVEGGAQLAGSFLRQGLVDRLIIFQAPVVLGSGAIEAFADIEPTKAPKRSRWRIVDHRVFGDDVMTTYALGAD